MSVDAEKNNDSNDIKKSMSVKIAITIVASVSDDMNSAYLDA